MINATFITVNLFLQFFPQCSTHVEHGKACTGNKKKEPAFFQTLHVCLVNPSNQCKDSDNEPEDFEYKIQTVIHF
ncbi:MAG: hypothetical protein AMS27_12265 [Bacteroides sp. SM23_62_1]|nr:MAG: hypothetical protein AMS27_12265 [Bacteroides sp. SM23_62_1]